MSLQPHTLEHHQIIQLMYKLRDKGLIDTVDVADIIDKAATEYKDERELLE